MTFESATQFHVYLPWGQRLLSIVSFNQEKALVGAFSVIVKTNCETDGSFHSTTQDPENTQHLPSDLDLDIKSRVQRFAAKDQAGNKGKAKKGRKNNVAKKKKQIKNKQKKQKKLRKEKKKNGKKNQNNTKKRGKKKNKRKDRKNKKCNKKNGKKCRNSKKSKKSRSKKKKQQKDKRKKIRKSANRNRQTDSTCRASEVTTDCMTVI